ncbi:MAG: hypothetical protein JSW03_01145 [Candidatus Eiseniibacteriota bacterium]|nr:MAG: hypothetical protein JSW03_01145 [Candidatus Eisenbacteria bacterium]
MRLYCASLGILVCALVGLALAGCSGPSVPERERVAPEEGLLERTTPEAVLWNLRLIYAEKDHQVETADDVQHWGEKYRELFHSDFKFYFIPEDAPPYLGQDWWGTDDEVAAFEGLLAAVVSGAVSEVRLMWTVNPALPDVRVDGSGQPLHPGWMWVHVSSLLLDIVQSENIYRVYASGDFYFAADPGDSTLWVVTEWFDREPGGWSGRHDTAGTELTAVVLTTWGRLKGLFR